MASTPSSISMFTALSRSWFSNLLLTGVLFNPISEYLASITAI